METTRESMPASHLPKHPIPLTGDVIYMLLASIDDYEGERYTEFGGSGAQEDE